MNEIKNETKTTTKKISKPKQTSEKIIVPEGAPEGIKQEFEKLNKVNENKEILEEVLSDSDLLNNFIITDPTNITIKELPKDDKVLELNKEIVLNKKAAKQVIAMQSGLILHMSALTLEEMYAIRNSELSFAAEKELLFKIIYKHIEETNIGYINYQQFLDLISYYDLDTLLFGIYCKPIQIKIRYH